MLLTAYLTSVAISCGVTAYTYFYSINRINRNIKDSEDIEDVRDSEKFEEFKENFRSRILSTIIYLLIPGLNLIGSFAGLSLVKKLFRFSENLHSEAKRDVSDNEKPVDEDYTEKSKGESFSRCKMFEEILKEEARTGKLKPKAKVLTKTYKAKNLKK